VTADDFGLARGINRGIMDCVERGIVTSVSLCVNGSEYEEALAFCRRVPGLSAGLHLVFTGEEALSAAAGKNGLCGRDGRLPGSWPVFLARYFLGGIGLRGLEKEIKAQFGKISSAGVRVTHVNSHQHLHLLPAILDIVISNCREYGVRYIRVPFSGPARHWLGADRRRAAWQIILNMLCARALSRVKKAGLQACTETSGVLYSGRMGRSELKGMIAALKEGKTEIICHPGRDGGELSSLYGGWGYAWDKETDSLCSADVKGSLKEYGISLCGFSPAEKKDDK